MPKLRFICEEHQEYGNLGWRPIDKKGFDPLSGMAVAHDLMEHFPQGDESTAHEIMAFGASIYVRRTYYAAKGQRYTRPSDNYAPEIGDMLRKILHGDVDAINRCPYPLHVRGNDYVNAEINHTISELREWVRSEMELEVENEGFHLSSEDERNIRGWLAEGYRRAVRRYQGVDRYDVELAFRSIETKADAFLKHAYVGQVIEARIYKRKHNGWSELGYSVEEVFSEEGY